MKNVVSILFLIFITITTFISIKMALFLISPATPFKEDIIIEISKGTSLNQISKLLNEKGIISDEFKFKIYGRYKGASSKIKAGEYLLNSHLKPHEVLTIITSGISIKHKIVIPEGYSIYQIADILENTRLCSKSEFLKKAFDSYFLQGLGIAGKSIEGYLFPDTYFFDKQMSLDQIIRSMINRFNEVFTKELEQEATALGFSKNEIITLSSMIERETGYPNERPIISSVFHNRLKIRMRLQSDPTVIYGIKNFNGNLTKQDLLTPSPYNTYTLPGLPESPIGNPGKESILAALHPARTEYLFFVSKNDGTHTFSKDYGSHRKNIQTFQLDPKMKEGKSWRNLQKKTKR